jgi:hypothetical protein
MLDRIRGARVSRRTALAIVLFALAVWAVVVYTNVRDFVPEELRSPPPAGRP